MTKAELLQSFTSADDPTRLHLVVRRPHLGTVRAIDHDSTTTGNAPRRGRPSCWIFGIGARQHSMGEFCLLPRARGMLARRRLCHAGAVRAGSDAAAPALGLPNAHGW